MKESETQLATRHPARNKDDLSVKLPAKMAAIENRNTTDKTQKREAFQLPAHRSASSQGRPDGMSNPPTRCNYTANII
jgi:hypothetical protein